MTESIRGRDELPLKIGWTWINRVKGEDWEPQVRRIIERDLFYFIRCPKCAITFFIEEAVDRGHHYGATDTPSFRLTCPLCETPIEQASIKRLKLKLEKVTDESYLSAPEEL